MIEAILFDLDGTLLDWESSLDQAIRDTLPGVPSGTREHLGQRFLKALEARHFVVREGLIVDRRHWMVSSSSEDLWKEALSGEHDDLIQATSNRFLQALDTVPFEDGLQVVPVLRGHYSMSILSNNPMAEQIATRLGLRPYFDEVLAPTGARKPDPGAFLEACGHIGAAPECTAYVGDSIINDVEAALAAGLVSVWLDRYQDPYAPPGAVHRISSLLELEGLLREV